jgi:hypothetical protein
VASALGSIHRLSLTAWQTLSGLGASDTTAQERFVGSLRTPRSLAVACASAAFSILGRACARTKTRAGGTCLGSERSCLRDTPSSHVLTKEGVTGRRRTPAVGLRGKHST